MKAVLAGLGLFTASLLSGCASTLEVQVPVWRPPAHDVSHVRAVAVPTFQGHEKYGTAARESLARAITQQHGAVVPDEQTLARDLPASVPYRGEEVDVRALVDQARRRGFDALVLGEVIVEGEKQPAVRIGNPKLKAQIQVQWIDLRSGYVVADHEAIKSWQGELSGNPQAKDSIPGVLTMLTEKATAEVAAKFLGRSEAVTVELSEAGEGDDEEAMEDGIAAAREGQWTAAAAHFDQALQANPRSFAASYNLAVAHEAQQQFAAARHWYGHALAARENEDCRAALARLDHARGRELATRPTGTDCFASFPTGEDRRY